MSQTRIAMFGGLGRMGREIISLMSENPQFSLVGIVDEGADFKEIETVSLEELKKIKPQAVIEFSSPMGLKKISKWCAETATSLVSGTTGLQAKEETELQALTKNFPLFRSANMSLGINALAKVLKIFTMDFPDCEIQIEEIHHKHKKDAPSGTALFLQKTVESVGAKSVKIWAPVSIRGGEVPGIHKVYFFSRSEWLCFEHHALNRSVFAEGALRAAQWIVGKKPGLYSMEDLLRNH